MHTVPRFFQIINRVYQGLMAHKVFCIMKDSVIKVDFEWAYQEVVSTHDFLGKDPGWVKSYVEAWCDGFLEGYLKGYVEGSIESICKMKQSGLSTDLIARCTGVSARIIDMM